ncbi:uncharacterized protein LOC112555829 [Pomacea canaliculata]|uniref:uncharacterized protein LOC112555829 n=1 Tax=Pomacea canaliculata TaxID=400727 RepID=UPI000D73C359|nr:uncharacterized protein LOC112555829 [Pomacea canaliculata]
MRAAILLCLLVAGATAECPTAGTGFLDGFKNFFCRLGENFKTFGQEALDGLQQSAIRLVTTVGGKMISGLQDLSKEIGQGSKRNIDMQTLEKVAMFVMTHRELCEDLIKFIETTGDVAASKLEDLTKEYLGNQSEQVLAKVITYIKAHTNLQQQIMEWVEKYSFQMALGALSNALKPKRSLVSEAEQLAQGIVSGLRPLVDKVVQELERAGHELLGQLGQDLPNFQQLLQSILSQEGLLPVEEAARELFGEVTSRGGVNLEGLLRVLIPRR